MSDIERRLTYLEDRTALQDLLVGFWAVGDSLSNIDEAVAFFTDDAVIDMSALNLPRLEGRAAIRECFLEAPSHYTHLAHFGTNFRVIRLDEDQAECRANVMAVSTTRSGVTTVNHVEYQLSFRRLGLHWKISALAERKLA